MSDNSDSSENGEEVGRATDYWDVHCSRCGDEYPLDRENALCESCVKDIQTSKLRDGVPCERCDGHGWIYDTWCDLQRAMHGRNTLCPECHGSGRVAWKPDLDAADREHFDGGVV